MKKIVVLFLCLVMLSSCISIGNAGTIPVSKKTKLIIIGTSVFMFAIGAIENSRYRDRSENYKNLFNKYLNDADSDSYFAGYFDQVDWHNTFTQDAKYNYDQALHFKSKEITASNNASIFGTISITGFLIAISSLLFLDDETLSKVEFQNTKDYTGIKYKVMEF